MAKPKTPLFSFGARGAIAKAVTYSKWKGVHVAKEYARPSNPQTASQTTQREAFGNAVAFARALFEYPDIKQSWNNAAGALGNRQSGFNLLVSAIKGFLLA